mmetsp:Transcript_13998/g.18246  ORF Transcript_13998/g.18246 Transcript_13998/m.18246 type:complete len:317 (+) Transcript_13998:419-1369(+)|eukprot:CAMPEP_0198149426 /NCGR_PEP_ID=MMETSP1443-20131203/46535_1 /TAXON_ID=186043 /ORGANISM="Entomoneis sp., Strain CCMP2396" /LENGTH=316 /DNA_ID=CAMNT_0043814455 /DNA_START=404 /DNA_END=1354 /DNA_ORIENTATION=-
MLRRIVSRSHSRKSSTALQDSTQNRKNSKNLQHEQRGGEKNRRLLLEDPTKKPQQQSQQRKKSSLRLSWFTRRSTSPQKKDSRHHHPDDSSLSSSSSTEEDDSSGGKAILKILSQEESLQFSWGNSTSASTENNDYHANDNNLDHLVGIVRELPSILSYQQQGRQVQFSEAVIHYHETILGDSPTVSCGAPLALGRVLLGQEGIIDISNGSSTSEEQNDALPDATATTTTDSKPSEEEEEEKSEYKQVAAEEEKKNTKFLTKKHQKLWIPESVRTQILIAAGVPEQEIKRAILFYTLTRQQEQLLDRHDTQRAHRS